MAIMKQPETLQTFRRNYLYEGVNYEGYVSVKRIRAQMRVRFNEPKRRLSISIRPGVSMEELDDFIIKVLPKLVKRVQKRNAPDSSAGNAIYLLGERRELEPGETLESVLRGKKKSILEYFTKRVRYYEKVMRISPSYKVRATFMRTLYGSNSMKTRSINLNLKLFCYTEDCIDSVVVHELAHDAHRNHGKMFYRKVLKYFPDYWICRKKLIHHIYNPILLNGQSYDNEPMEENDDE